MKKNIFAWLLAASIFACTESSVYAGDISAKAAIVYEPLTETVLFEKDADERLLVASTTKIMTAKVVMDNCALNEKVEVTKAHTAVEGSSMYLRPGGDYTVEDLLYGLILASGNDAAAALAEHTAGSMEAFADLMNAECRKLGLKNSHFVNSHGLDAEEHYSSARDLAVITAAAMENESFCKIFSSPSYSVDGGSFYNHNKLLSSFPDCIGGKTGYTKKAGRILVSCAERDGMRLICVTISDPNDWKDHTELYEQCFGEYEFIPALGEKDGMELVSGIIPSVGLSCEKAGIVALKEDRLEVKLHLPRFAFAPVSEGDNAGYMEVLQAGKTVAKADIFYAETVPVDRNMALSFWERLNFTAKP